MVRLQQDIADYRAELKLIRTPAVSTRYWDSVQTTVEASAPTPEVPAVEKLLQRLLTDTQSRPLPVVNSPAPTELEQSMRPFLAEQRRRHRGRQPCSGQVVTATGDGDTELSPSGCESSSTDIIRTVDVLVHRGTAPATATATATATRPAGLERCVMFLLWECRVMQQHDART